MSASLLQYLTTEFERRKKKNTRYSLRSFARDLDTDATALSRILAGKRAIGTKTAQRFLTRLKVSPATREALLRSLVSPQDHGVPSDRDYIEITPGQMERMDDWIYSATLELARSRKGGLDIPKLAGYFEISIERSEDILKTLFELGLLKKTQSGYRKAHARSTMPFKEGSLALRRIKAGYIDKSKDALKVHPEESHDISGITVLIARDKLPEASRRIKEFRRSLAQFLATDTGDDLYRINIQLFPLKSKAR